MAKRRFPLLVAALFLLWAGGARAVAARPANDFFGSPKALPPSFGAVVGATNVGATSERGEFSAGDGATIWYSLAVGAEGYLTVTFDSANSNGGGVLLSLHQPAATVSRSLSLVPAYPQTTADGRSRVVAAVAAGTRVLLQFDSNFGTGAFNFEYAIAGLGAFGIADPPHSDPAFQSPTWVYNRTDSSTAEIVVKRFGSTQGSASVDYQITDETSTPDVDYTFPAGGHLQFAPGETSQTLAIPLHDRAGVVSFTLSLLNPSAGSAVIGSGFTNLEGDVQSVVQVVLESGLGAPANDDFANAIVLTQSSGTPTLPPGVATLQPGEPLQADQSVWYRWTAPSGGILSVDAGTGSFHLPIALYTGDTLATLVPKNSTAGPFLSGPQVSPTYAVESGVTYTIAVLEDDGAGNLHGGAYALSYSFTSNSTYYFPTVRAAGAAPVHYPYDPVVLTVRRNDTQNAASVSYTVASAPGAHAAVANHDFTPATGMLHFDAGVAEQTITVPLKTHSVRRGSLSLQVSLDTPASVVGANVATVSIEEGYFGSFIFSSYFAALKPASAGNDGYIKISPTRLGTFTGVLSLHGFAVPFIGKFPLADFPADQLVLDLHSTVNLVVNGQPLQLALTLHESELLDYSLAGQVVDPSGPTTLATFSAPHQVFSYPNPGLYNFTGTPQGNLPAALQAPLFGALRVSSRGAYLYEVALPDGTVASGGGQVVYQAATGSFTVPIAASLYRGGGVVTGSVNLFPQNNPRTPEVALSGDGNGALRWTRFASTPGQSTPPFTASTGLQISRVGFGPGAVLYGESFPQSFHLTFTGTDLPNGSVTFPVTLLPGRRFTPQTVSGVTLESVAFYTGAGFFYGALKLPGKPAFSFAGAYLSDLATGSGSFFENHTAGTVSLAP